VKNSGQRLVGADKADHGSIPFIVAWTSEVDEERDESECTGVNGVAIHRGSR
jgi:hypothetical protein